MREGSIGLYGHENNFNTEKPSLYKGDYRRGISVVHPDQQLKLDQTKENMINEAVEAELAVRRNPDNNKTNSLKAARDQIFNNLPPEYRTQALKQVHEELKERSGNA